MIFRALRGWGGSVASGHVGILSGLVLLAVLSVLAVGFALLEIVHLGLWPARILAGKFLTSSGSAKPKVRRIVIFDGICVLCNTFGRFVVPRLNDKDSINFVPYQDPSANPHVNVSALEKEFPSLTPDALQHKICAIRGNDIFWGADAIMVMLSWCHYPYPIAKIGWLIPSAIRNAVYGVVANNRYDVFGTQPLEQNFAKKLCPYLFVKNVFMGSASEKKQQ